MQRPRSYRHLDIITTIFVVVMIVSNICAIKALRIPGTSIDIDGGTILFPLSYIFGDVLVEVYGYARTRRVIWMAFAANIVAALSLAAVVALPSAPGWTLQGPFATILGQAPRIVMGSLIAFFVGEFVNSYIMAKMKVWMGGKRLWMRTIGSTIVGEGFDSLLFTVLAFGGVWPWATIWSVIFWNYLAKVLIEVLATPFTYMVINYLKAAEREDYYDRYTDFNPFSLSEN